MPLLEPAAHNPHQLLYDAPVSRLLLGGLAVLVMACGGSQKPAAVSAPAPTSGIHGTVVDVETGSAISFVTVIAKADGAVRSYSHTTNGSGSFILDGVPPGRYQVIATYGNHSSEKLDVPVTRNKITRLRLGLDLRTNEPIVNSYKPIPSVPEPPKRSIGRARSGAIEGVVRNAKTKALLPGAVVGATSAKLPEPRLAVADAHGRYRLLGLPPGTYVLSIYYTVVERGNVEVRRGGIQVAGGKATIIDLNLDTEKY